MSETQIAVELNGEIEVNKVSPKVEKAPIEKPARRR
jgi:hypothetical protein